MRKAKPEASAALLETLKFIVEFTKEKGYQPSQTEIAAGLSITQPSIRDRLKQLEKRGYITLTGQDRAIGITGIRYQPILDETAVEEEIKRRTTAPKSS